MICVVMLQNCMYCVEGETGSCSQTVVKCDVDGTEEVSIKVQESIDIKDETPEAVVVPFVKTEHEVRLWGVCVCVCVRWWQVMVSDHLLPKKETINLQFIVFCFVLYCGCRVLLKFVMKS
jgi:hypothetical protein